MNYWRFLTKANSNAAVLVLRLYQQYYRNNQSRGADGFHLPKMKREDQEKEKKVHLQSNIGDLSLEKQFGMGQGKN